jgi:PKD repeat protein
MSGRHTVRLLAGDGNATSEVAWNVTVVHVNRAPHFTILSPKTDVNLQELMSCLFCATAEDDDGDTVVYGWTFDGASVADGPSFNYTTGYFSAGNHTVSVTVSDGSLEDTHSWNVRVANLNRAPRISSFEPPGDPEVGEYGTLGLSVQCADDDGDLLSVLWYVDNATEPAGNGSMFNFTPGYSSAGSRNVTAVVSDGAKTARHVWNVRVTRAVAEWTVLVYMNADCDLEPYLVEDFNEMELAGSTENVNIVVQMDRHPGYDATSGDWSGTRRYRVEKDPGMRAMNSRLLEDLGELDMGDKKTLSDFLLWGREKFPARRTLVVLSGHGEGWPGISQDFTDQNDRLSLDELSAGLGDFTRSRGAPIDVLLLDVCYWAMLETDWALRNLTSYIVASEDIDPSAGQRYDAFLDDLVKVPGMAPRDLAMEIVASFREAYSSGGYYPGDSETFTLSAVETARLGPLASALDGLADLLEGNLSALAPAVKAARGAVETYGKPEYIDLGDFVSGLRSRSADDGLNVSADAVLSALNDTVAARAGGTLRTRSRGISIYFPSQSFSYRTSYADLSFSGEHSWDALLKAYHNATGRSVQGRSGGAGQAGAPALPEPPHLSVSERKGLYVPSAESQRFTFAGGS